MNKNILNIGIQDFIVENLNTDILSILLKKQLFDNVSNQELVEQAEAKTRCKKKLPLWFSTPLIYYPNKLNIEQTSSEKAARYKADLIVGKKLIDLTGGFGVDAFYFSRRFDQVVHCEINQDLSKIASHNFEQLGAKNIKCTNIDGMDYLKASDEIFDCIYIDPSRRNNAKGKVFMLEDCLPDVPRHLDLLLKKGKMIIIKTSPMLDITLGLKELKFVEEIHILAIHNEVKELLWIISSESETLRKIKTVNISNKDETFEYSPAHQQTTQVKYALPLQFLYEPNAAIMKSGAFNLITEKYNTPKLHEHSHLYTSDTLKEFPGRKFKIESIAHYSPKNLKKILSGSKANIATRNFPETPDQIKKRLNVKDGGDSYLFFTTDMNNSRIVIFCSKIS